MIVFGTICAAIQVEVRANMSRILEVDNRQDVIDSRDIIARIGELESEREVLQEAVTEAHDAFSSANNRLDEDAVEQTRQAMEDAQQALGAWDTDTEEAEELKVLKALAEECEEYSEWEDGATLIRDSYFEDYAQELAEDCCEMPKELHWPFTCIDWTQAADELKMDYMCIDYDGVDYWMRA
jgi:hypothetical protein